MCGTYLTDNSRSVSLRCGSAKREYFEIAGGDFAGHGTLMGIKPRAMSTEGAKVYPFYRFNFEEVGDSYLGGLPPAALAKKWGSRPGTSLHVATFHCEEAPWPVAGNTISLFVDRESAAEECAHVRFGFLSAKELRICAKAPKGTEVLPRQSFALHRVDIPLEFIAEVHNLDEDEAWELTNGSPWEKTLDTLLSCVGGFPQWLQVQEATPSGFSFLMQLDGANEAFRDLPLVGGDYVTYFFVDQSGRAYVTGQR